MAYKLVGQDFTPPDVLAKVTGQAKYSEDVRAEGMLHGKMVVSPMPHARVRSIDASAAKAMLASGAYGEGADVAALVAFVAGPQAQYITGACLNVDGGYLA